MKTGTILIGVGAVGVVGYLLYKKFGAQLNLPQINLPSIISEQPNVLTPQEKFDKIVEALPAPTKAPATVEQQAQTAKIVAMLNESIVDSQQSIVAPPPALKEVQPVATYEAPLKQVQTVNEVISKPATVSYQQPVADTVKLVTKPVVVPITNEVIYVASVVDQTKLSYTPNTRTKEYLAGVAI